MSSRPITLQPQAVPRQIGKYIVSHALGEGAMGVVYKAVDPHIHRVVAIKTIRRPLLEPDAQDIAAAQRFRLEAQAAGRLNHPNIVSIYEYGESGDDVYIAMEHVEGRSLLSLMGHGVRLALPDVLSVMCQLLDALGCAHAQGVCHRDIKPANLIVTPDGVVKVADFGIARIDAAGPTQISSVVGSPGYMAPERYTGVAPDQRVDLFSCGVLLYELLTGVVPFRGSPSEVMYQVLHQEPLAPSLRMQGVALPLIFDTIVARALAKRADNRYASAAEMREALLAAAQPAVVASRLTPAVAAQARAPSTGADAYAATQRAPASDGSAGRWDPQALERVEALLRPLLGPISRIAVREVARRSSSMSSLIAKLAAGSLASDERAAFLERSATLFHDDAGQAEARREPSLASPPPGPLPVLGDTPMRPDIVEKAQQLLTAQIGPIAAVIVRRAAATGSRERFFCMLADQLGDGVDRRELLRRLWRIR
jgi:eukaryotic-like serine/threonine-protein kinase